MSTYLDTRDLNERKTELESLRDAVTEAEEALQEAKESALDLAADEEIDRDEQDHGATRAELEEDIADAERSLESAKEAFGDDEKAELAELEELESEISEWRHGETLIPENSFTDYIMETLEDCGTLPKDLPWYVAIDREQTAENCKADYTEVEYQGTTYLVRSC